MFQFRPLQVPDDYPRLSELFTADRPEPVSVEQIAEGDSRIPTPGPVRHDEQGRLVSHCRDRLVATDESGLVVAYAEIWRAPWSPPGWLFPYVLVDSARRHQGLGTRVLRQVEAIAREKRAEWVYSEIRDSYTEAIAWVKRHGYEIERHSFESTLDLSAFDESPFGGAVEAVTAGGLRFATLAEEPGEATERKLHALSQQTAEDIPGYPGDFMPFGEWRKWTLEGERVPYDGVIFALDGDQVAGATFCKREDSGAFYTTYTGVDRAYRGRGLALALKLLAVRAAKRHGAPYMRTNNDSLNGPMLAVNRNMGYQPEPGLYRIRKRFD
ncbi:MAG: GNAT family N-acetyltransferase [Bacillota bacterium]